MSSGTVHHGASQRPSARRASLPIQRLGPVATAHGFALFETALGPCGIIWASAGSLACSSRKPANATHARVFFSDFRMRARLRRRPMRNARATASWAPSRRGERFFGCRARHGSRATVPSPRLRGRARHSTGRYGLLWRHCGAARRACVARAVGQALGRNRSRSSWPCHRVLAAGGKLGGFSAYGGVATKLRLLAIEGAHVN